MAQVIQDFVEHLGGITEVTTFAGVDIFPLLGQPGIDKFIVYSPRGGIQESFYVGSFGKTELRVQLDIYSKSFSDNQTVKDAIVTTFNGFSGELNSNTFIQMCVVESSSADLNRLDEDYYRDTLEITLTY